MNKTSLLEVAREKLASMSVEDLEVLCNKYGFYPVLKGTDPEDTQYRIKIRKIEEFEVIMTNRGPTVVLTSDLRDFGKEDLGGIVKWLEGIGIPSEYEGLCISLRDCSIICSVEYGSDYLIKTEFDEEDQKMKFILQEIKVGGEA